RDLVLGEGGAAAGARREGEGLGGDDRGRHRAQAAVGAGIADPARPLAADGAQAGGLRPGRRLPAGRGRGGRPLRLEGDPRRQARPDGGGRDGEGDRSGAGDGDAEGVAALGAGGGGCGGGAEAGGGWGGGGGG